MRQLTLGLVLSCPSSVRGVTELLADRFDDALAVGAVPNLLTDAVASARAVNARHGRAGVRLGAHDEIFQAGRPVLVGAWAETTSCYRLCQAERRAAATGGSVCWKAWSAASSPRRPSPPAAADGAPANGWPSPASLAAARSGTPGTHSALW